jgi:hypothetical protein
MSHGGYLLFEPVEMVGENKEYFNQILIIIKKQL